MNDLDDFPAAAMAAFDVYILLADAQGGGEKCHQFAIGFAIDRGSRQANLQRVTMQPGAGGLLGARLNMQGEGNALRSGCAEPVVAEH